VLGHLKATRAKHAYRGERAIRLLPARLFAPWEGLKKLCSNVQFTFQRPWLAFTLYLSDRNEPGYGFCPTRNDHLLALRSLLN